MASILIGSIPFRQKVDESRRSHREIKQGDREGRSRRAIEKGNQAGRSRRAIKQGNQAGKSSREIKQGNQAGKSSREIKQGNQADYTPKHLQKLEREIVPNHRPGQNRGNSLKEFPLNSQLTIEIKHNEVVKYSNCLFYPFKSF